MIRLRFFLSVLYFFKKSDLENDKYNYKYDSTKDICVLLLNDTILVSSNKA
jgi:hypothetical protein